MHNWKGRESLKIKNDFRDTRYKDSSPTNAIELPTSCTATKFFKVFGIAILDKIRRQELNASQIEESYWLLQHLQWHSGEAGDTVIF